MRKEGRLQGSQGVVSIRTSCSSDTWCTMLSIGEQCARKFEICEAAGHWFFTSSTAHSYLLLYDWWKEKMWAMIPDQEREYNSEAQ